MELTINHFEQYRSKKILICGDSFAADWTVKYPQGRGWVNYLSDRYNVTNCAQAGCSEWKILKQILSQNLNNFSHIIVSHTSPNRIPVIEHPIHHTDLLHRNSDLIYLDIKYHSEKHENLKPIVDYFEKYFDIEYGQYCYDQIVKNIDEILKGFSDLKILHITNLAKNPTYLSKTGKHKNYSSLQPKHSGLHNHFDDYANNLVFEDIHNFINDKS